MGNPWSETESHGGCSFYSGKTTTIENSTPVWRNVKQNSHLPFLLLSNTVPLYARYVTMVSGRAGSGSGWDVESHLSVLLGIFHLTSNASCDVTSHDVKKVEDKH